MWQLSTLTQQVTTNKEYSELTNAHDYLIYHIVNQKEASINVPVIAIATLYVPIRTLQ